MTASGASHLSLFPRPVHSMMAAKKKAAATSESGALNGKFASGPPRQIESIRKAPQRTYADHPAIQKRKNRAGKLGTSREYKTRIIKAAEPSMKATARNPGLETNSMESSFSDA